VASRWRGGDVSQAEPGTSAEDTWPIEHFCIYKYQLATQIEKDRRSSDLTQHLTGTYAYTGLWEHCLFCGDCTERRKAIYIHLVLALLRPVGNALLTRLTPECGKFATIFVSLRAHLVHIGISYLYKHISSLWACLVLLGMSLPYGHALSL
jgi:hypothetical protein